MVTSVSRLTIIVDLAAADADRRIDQGRKAMPKVIAAEVIQTLVVRASGFANGYL